MKRFLVLAAFACAFTGCKESKPFTDPLCDTAIKAITGAAQGVAGALGCANLPAVAAAMSKPVKDLAICKEGQQGLIGDMRCLLTGSAAAVRAAKQRKHLSSSSARKPLPFKWGFLLHSGRFFFRTVPFL